MPRILAGVGGFSFGIFFASVLVPSAASAAFFILLGGVCAAASRLESRGAYAVAALFFFAAALGIGRMFFATPVLPAPFTTDLRHRVTYTGVVLETPDLRDTTARVVVRVRKENATAHILVSTNRYAALTAGDTVRVTGTVMRPDSFTDDSGRVFQYDKYLAKDGILLTMSFASVRVTQSAPWYSVRAALSRAKQAFLSGIGRALPEPHASFAGGIVIGGKSGLGDDLENDFIRSGLVQIIVLSGYNVMVVAEWIMLLARSLRVPRAASACFGALALMLFVAIAGVSATALRATLMALIALYARATGRSYAAGRALLIVVGMMVLYEPLFLVYDPGFDLSIAATAGLIWLAPLIEVRLAFLKSASLQNALATTIAAQIAVLPLLLYETGNLSFVSVPANLAVIFVTPLAMGAAALAGLGGVLFGAWLPIASTVVGMPAYFLSAYCIWVAKTAAALPFGAAAVPAFPFMFVVLGYAPLLLYLRAANRSSHTPQLMLAKKASR
jgi:competence protein ComEC